MSDGTAAALGPVFAYAMIALFRALRSPVTRPAAKPARSAVDLRPLLRRVIPPPPATDDVPESRATLRHKWPIPSEGPIVVPVERWERGEELLAWRFWKLGRLRSDGGVRLLSFRAPCAWDGPVLRAHRLPSESPFSATGGYALKAEPPLGADVHHSDECWVSGWVALSGRVVEHQHGYRAERAVIRQLRLGLGLHLRITAPADIVALAQDLERRYQAPVDLGVESRSFARGILAKEKDQWLGGIPEIPEGFRVE
ncbi:MAG TPA: hypothetical protein VKP10_19525 [Gemmatimonadales bacterium]|nr:hypothetical protein [Gemmatimonadales bacterium]